MTYQQTGVPLANLGLAGDTYYQQDTGQLWQKSLPLAFGQPPIWQVVSVPGTPGPRGPAGSAGSPGVIGSQGAAGTPGAMTLVSTLTASSASSFSWTGLAGSAYMLWLNNVIPATDAKALRLQVGVGGVPTYNATGSYQWAGLWVRGAGSVTGVSGTNDTAISISGENLSNDAASGVSGTVTLHNFQSGSAHKQINSDLGFFDDTAIARVITTGYWNGDATAITAVKIFFATGNIATGNASLYALGQ